MQRDVAGSGDVILYKSCFDYGQIGPIGRQQHSPRRRNTRNIHTRHKCVCALEVIAIARACCWLSGWRPEIFVCVYVEFCV